MPENAAIYVSDPSMIGSRLFDVIQSIQSYEPLSQGGNATGFLLTLSWGTVRVNILPSDELPRHMEGFERYIRSQLTDRDNLIYLLSRHRHVRMCLGCVLMHDSAAEDETVDFLFEFNAAVHGVLFLYDSVWDWTGDALCGPHHRD